MSKNVIEFNNYLKVVIFLGLILGGFLNLFYEYIVKLKIKNNNLKNTIKNNKFKKHNGNLVGFDNLNNNPVYLLDKDANSHTLLIGTTGSGKTTAICSIVENVIKRRKALFYVDGKGDMTLARRVETYAKKSSVPFYLFSLNSQSIKYNPIASGGYTSKKDRIIELRNWTEEHYKKIAEGYLQTIFQVLEELGLQVDLYLLSKYLDLDELSILARKAKSRYLFNIISKLEKNSKDVSSLIFEIENLVNSEIGHVFDCSSGNVLTLESAMKENAIVYFCLNTLAFPSYSNIIGKLIINDLKNLFSMQLDVEKKNYVYTIFDEFSVFAGSQVINLINQGREVGVCALLATQSVSDITAVGGKSLLGQILNSCNNYIIQRQNNPDDA
ncbi:MAG: DUF853 family protein, partial [Legionellales bacterium]|nr:DUF853 family protein [Legionellales bacterium]